MWLENGVLGVPSMHMIHKNKLNLQTLLIIYTQEVQKSRTSGWATPFYMSHDDVAIEFNVYIV